MSLAVELGLSCDRQLLFPYLLSQFFLKGRSSLISNKILKNKKLII